MNLLFLAIKKAFQRKACNKEGYMQLVFVGDRKIV